MKQQMKDKHRASKNKSTKLCESHIVKTSREVKWMKLNNNPNYNSYPRKLHRIKSTEGKDSTENNSSTRRQKNGS